MTKTGKILIDLTRARLGSLTAKSLPQTKGDQARHGGSNAGAPFDITY
jgi:hypothetical protein